MKLACWNVNSVRARQERLLRWLGRHSPDVLCLQELKVEAEKFPADALRDAGYTAVVAGQKTYNGVAILARSDPTDVRRGLDDGVDDGQARFVSALVDGTRVLNVYVPNGGEVGSDKWTYKLEWLGRLRRYLTERHDPQEPLILCGDFNVAPSDADIANPAAWQSGVLCHPEARAELEALLAWGLVDVFGREHPNGGIYSWWDYRGGAFSKDEGLRIDLILATEPVADLCAETLIDREEREGPSPSDHAPVVAIFDTA
jgi:exodeoxyribonuclease-3